MLTELRIKNFAIIESLSLPLARGFNVLSGETGAGKSIIVGALGLLLGERASAELIRTGSDRASVEGVFDLTGRDEVARALDERGIEVEEHTVVLKREIAAAGRTRAWVNGSTVTAGVLAEIGRQLVNLHGQHEAQTLLDADSQRRILDAFGGSTAQAERVREAAAALAAVREEMRALAARRTEAAAPRGLPPARREGDRGREAAAGRGRAAGGGGAPAGARRRAAHALGCGGRAHGRRRGRRAAPARAAAPHAREPGAHRSGARAAERAVRQRLLRARGAVARAGRVRARGGARPAATGRGAAPPRPALPAVQEVRADPRRRHRGGPRGPRGAGSRRLRGHRPPGAAGARDARSRAARRRPRPS